jgi:hypothetical protein
MKIQVYKTAMLPVGFYDPETSSLTLMEEDK